MPKLCLLILLSLPVLGQNAKLEKEQIEQIKSNEQYWYADKELEPEIQKALQHADDATSILETLELGIRIFFWVLTFSALAYILYFVFSKLIGNRKNQNKKEKEDFEHSGAIETKTDLENLDYPALIEKAKATGDYRLAVRWYFLLLLKQLSQKNLITFSRYTTNTQYLGQLAHKLPNEKLLEIKNCTRNYEHVWFGQYPVNESLFARLEHGFKHTVQAI